jgi:hypothetical protein
MFDALTTTPEKHPAFVRSAKTQSGNDTLITLDAHDTLLLKNVLAVNLHANDFIMHA